MTSPLSMADGLQLKHLRVEFPRVDIALVVLDQPEKSANVLTAGLQMDLETCLDFLHLRQGLRGAILFSAKPRIFVAGADLVQIARTLDWSDDEIINFCRRGQRLYHRFREGSFVSAAAIRGACVGGGLELALACDFQVAADDPKPTLGLPEVKLGLIPGWAGTVRVPRLIGLEPAIDLVTSGRSITPAEAVRLGLIHAAVPAEGLIEAAVHLIDQATRDGTIPGKRARELGPVANRPPDIPELESSWIARVAAKTDVHFFAPEVAIKHMCRSASQEFWAACDSEAAAMSQVYGSPSNYGLLNNYFLGEHNRRHPGKITLRASGIQFDSIGVVGLGVMGRAIVQSCAKKEKVVFGFDTDEKSRRDFSSELPPGATNILLLSDLDGLRPADLIIEAITERTEAKRDVLRQISRVASPDAVIATNTSTIPLAKLVQAVDRAERFCGIHFCHPELMSLVEVVVGTKTSAATLNAAVEWLRGSGKIPVVVADAPGFVVNRILAAYLEAAIQLCVEGVSIVEVDSAMRQFGFQVGPFEMMDIIGIDTTVHAGQSLLENGVIQVSRVPILLRFVQRKWLGRKTCRGFYRYEAPRGKAIDEPESEAAFATYRTAAAAQLSSGQIAERMLAEALIAACDVVDKNIVADPRDVDICWINGLSFPTHRGGLLFWAGRQTPAALRESIEWARGLHPEMNPPEPLRNWMASGKEFYLVGDQS